MSTSGWLRFTTLHLGEQPLAYHFGFLFDNRLLWYKPSFDASLASRSPGEALLKELVDWVCESGIDELDFTVGDEAFKRRFANRFRDNISVTLYASGVPFRIDRAYRRLKRLVKTHRSGRAVIALAKRTGLRFP